MKPVIMERLEQLKTEFGNPLHLRILDAAEEVRMLSVKVSNIHKRRAALKKQIAKLSDTEKSLQTAETKLLGLLDLAI